MIKTLLCIGLYFLFSNTSIQAQNLPNPVDRMTGINDHLSTLNESSIEGLRHFSEQWDSALFEYLHSNNILPDDFDMTVNVSSAFVEANVPDAAEVLLIVQDTLAARQYFGNEDLHQTFNEILGFARSENLFDRQHVRRTSF